MPWRVHLTNQAIHNLHILPGSKPVLTVWTRRDHAAYYDLETGAVLGEATIPTPPAVSRQSDIWQEYAGGLTGPRDRAYLPVVETSLMTIHTTTDGKMRLYQTGETELILETDNTESILDVQDADRFLAIELDRALGLIAALDENGKLHIYQQDIRVGAFDIGLNIEPDLRPALALSQGGGTILATDGRQIVLVDSGGTVLKRLDVHYFIGRMACSPGGQMLVASEIESGVVRVYDAEKLIPTHQRHAIDLLLKATQVQLIAELPPEKVAVSALAAYSKGVIAFAMSGVVCVTGVEEMNELPRPQALF